MKSYVKKYKKRTQIGFTLIELLVVVAIVSFLATVILVALNSARDKARIGSVQAEFMNLERALALYYHDHGRYLPIAEVAVQEEEFLNAMEGYIPRPSNFISRIQYASFEGLGDNGYMLASFNEADQVICISGEGYTYDLAKPGFPECRDYWPSLRGTPSN